MERWFKGEGRWVEEEKQSSDWWHELENKGYVGYDSQPQCQN